MKQMIAALTLAGLAGAAMASEASGSFEVTLKPVPAAPKADDTRGRMLFDKTFKGGLAGASTGEMLTAGVPQRGSAGYVALERFEGTLDGRSGSFVMQHSGTMDAGQQYLDIRIAPGSGTGELTGIRGSLQITITGGKHFYTMQYTLP